MERLFRRLLGRLRRLARPGPRIIPGADSAIRDPALEGVAADTFFTKCSSFGEFETFAAQHSQLFQDRAAFESALVPPNEYFSIVGFCVPCNQETTFMVDYLYSLTREDGTRVPNWRERVICGRCKLPNRLRAAADFMEHALKLDPSSTLYVSEQTTPFYRFLKRRYPKTFGSEFLTDGTACGRSNWLGIRHEDLTKLSLDTSSVDAICTSDVLEHVPNYTSAISECFRVLKPGGSLIISVPFLLGSRETLVRARINADGALEHLLTPEYHGDPVNARGVLCYYHFGWDLLDSLKAAGFNDAALYFYWSCRYGYLGGMQFLICATR